MHAPYDKSGNNSYRTKPKSGVRLLVLFSIAGLVLTLLTTLHPKASTWIAQAVEAEFGRGIAADMPVETAQPGMAIPMRTVDAY